MAERKGPTPEDRVAAVRIALSGIVDETDLGELRTRVEPLDRPRNTFLGEVFLELAADAIEVSGASRVRPIEFEKIRERYLPECTTNTKATASYRPMTTTLRQCSRANFAGQRQVPTVFAFHLHH